MDAIPGNNANCSNTHNANAAAAAAAPNNGAAGQYVIREQDRFMPIANVIRIMRRVLPSHAKISDDAKETIQECVSEYISFITSEANERCQREQRKTITAEDVIWAMSKLGFDDYVDPLTYFLHRYREVEGDHRGGSIRGDPLPVRRTGSGAGLVQLQPAPMSMGNPAVGPGVESGLFGTAGMNPAAGMNMGPNHHHHHQQQGVVYGDSMGGYYFGGPAYGDGYGGNNSGSFDPYAPYR